MNKLEEIKTKIDADKEILEAFPKNNKKNLNAYIQKLAQLNTEFSGYNEEVWEEIKKRYKKFKNVKSNPEIDKLQTEIANYKGILYLLNDIETSYEKMDLDKAIQNLNYYYKKNLEIVNESILYGLRKFEEIGIPLEENDFQYSNYVKEYISTFLWELKNGDINSKRIEAKFEEIYWKCPDIITHIELNFRYLYLKNEKAIDKYYLKQKEVLLKNFTTNDIYDRYNELEKQLLYKQKDDKFNILNSFTDGDLNIKEYSKNAIQSYYSRFIDTQVLSNASKDELNEIDINLIKLMNSIYEYNNYLKFKFILDNIKNIYLEKDKYKKAYNDAKQQIVKKEQKLFKLNKKINAKKEANEKFASERDALIMEIKESYKELDKSKVYNKVATELNDNSTIKEVLFFANSFYKYLFDCIKVQQTEWEEEEIDNMISELRAFVRWPYFTILDNIIMLDNKDMLLIIKDRYQLLNINITKEDLELDNMESVIEILKKIEVNHYMKINKVKTEEIEVACEFQKILITN